MSDLTKRGLMTFLGREERRWRNAISRKDDPLARGYAIGQAHAFAMAIRYVQALRKTRKTTEHEKNHAR